MNIKNKIQEYIMFWTELQKELDKPNNSSDIIYSTYEVSFVDEPCTYIYSPKRVFSKTETCDSCQGMKYIKQPSDNNVHYKVCDCVFSSVSLQTEEIPVYGVYNECEYNCFISGEQIRIPVNSIKDCFSVEDVKQPLETLYYKNKCDCDKVCEYLTGGTL